MTRLGTPERDKSGPKSSELPDDATGWGLVIDDKLKAGGGDLRHGGTELGGQLGLGGRPVELRRRVEDAPDLLDQRHRAMMVRRDAIVSCYASCIHEGCTHADHLTLWLISWVRSWSTICWTYCST